MNVKSSPVRFVIAFVAGLFAAFADTAEATTGSAGDYVRDGLVALWDGYENAGPGVRDARATKWVDHVGGVEIELPEWVAVEELSLYSTCGTSHVSAKLESIAHLSSTDSHWTIEIVQQSGGWKATDDYNNLQYVFATPRGTIGYRRNDAKGFYFYGPSSDTQCSLQNWVHSTAQVADLHTTAAVLGQNSKDQCSIWMDGVQGIVDYNGNYSADKLTQFVFFGNKRMDVRVYAIRVYNRALTAEEIDQNAQLDRARFVKGGAMHVEVKGLPFNCGDVTGYGVRVMKSGSNDVFSVTSPYVDPDTGVSYACTGWALQNAAGQVIQESEAGSTSCAYTHGDEYRRLVWLWTTDAWTPTGSAIYVSNGTGNDGNTGADWAHAVKTVAAGVEKVGLGGTVYLTPGRHQTTATVTLTNGVSLVGCGTKPADVTVALEVAYEEVKNVILIQQSANTVVTNLSVTNNRNHNDSGIWMDSGMVTHCCVTGCVTKVKNGGGICMTGGVVRFCEITKCEAYSTGGSSVHGGGVYMTGGVVECCRIGRCDASSWTGSSSGGGAYVSQGTLRNCLVVGCRAMANGSGVSARPGAIVENCTIVGNEGYNASSKVTAAGLYADDNSNTKVTYLRNNIIWGNFAADGVTARDVSLSSNIADVNVKNNTSPTMMTKGTDNSDVPPVFADDDYRLDYCAAVGTGVVTADMANLLDLDGKPRTVGDLVDRGCYQRDVSGELECAIEELEKDDAQDSASVRMKGKCTVSVPESGYYWTLKRKADGEIISAQGQTFDREVPTGVWDVLLSVTNGAHSAEKFYDGAIDIRASRAYVSNGTGVYPYLTPETGTNSPYEAFATLGEGGVLYVGDGVFTLEHQLTLEAGKGSRIESLNGPENAVIKLADSTVFRDGKYRGVKIAKANARVEGVTFVGGAKGLYNDGAAYSHYGFVLMSSAASGAVVTNCVFRDVSCNIYGVTAGVEMYAGTLVDSSFANVTASSSGSVSIKGGVILQSGGLVDRVTVKNCKSEGKSSSNGAGDMVYVEGGVMQNSLVRSCSCVNGEAVYVNGGTFVNNTVVANTNSLPNLKEKHTYAGGVKVAAGTVANCVIADNWSKPYGAVSNVTGRVGISHTLVNGVDDASFVTAANHNVIGEPRFEDAAGGDYRLAWNSPAITAGSNAALGTDAAVAAMKDLAGAARLNGSAVDLGCYESAFYDRYVALEEVTGDGAGISTGMSDPTQLTAPIVGAQKVPDGDVLVHEYVPAYDKMARTYGLFDMVTGTFSGSNTGTPFGGVDQNRDFTYVWKGESGSWTNVSGWAVEGEPYWRGWPGDNGRGDDCPGIHTVRFGSGTATVTVDVPTDVYNDNRPRSERVEFADDSDVTFVMGAGGASVSPIEGYPVAVNGILRIQGHSEARKFPFDLGGNNGFDEMPRVYNELHLTDVRGNPCGSAFIFEQKGELSPLLTVTDSVVDQDYYGLGFVSFGCTNEDVAVRLAMTNSIWRSTCGTKDANAVGKHATVSYSNSTNLSGIIANYFQGAFTIDNSVVGYQNLHGTYAKAQGLIAGEEGDTFTATDLTICGANAKLAVSENARVTGTLAFVMPEGGFTNDVEQLDFRDSFHIDTAFADEAPFAVVSNLDLTAATLTVDATAITKPGRYPLVRVGAEGKITGFTAFASARPGNTLFSIRLFAAPAQNLSVPDGFVGSVELTEDGKEIDVVLQRDITSAEVEWTWDAEKVNFWHTGVAGTYPAVTGTVGGVGLTSDDYDILLISNNGKNTNRVDSILSSDVTERTYTYRVVGKNNFEGEKDILSFKVVRQTVVWTDESGDNAVGNWSDDTRIPQDGENMGNDGARANAPSAEVNARLASASHVADIRLDAAAEQPNVYKVVAVPNTTSILHDGILTLGMNGNLTVESGAKVVFSNATVKATSRRRELTINSYGMMVFAGDNTLDGVMPYIQGGATKGVTLSFEDGVTTMTEKHDGRVSISAGLNCNTVRVANAQVTMPTLSCFNSENTQFEFVLGDNNTVGGPAMLNVTKEFVLTQRIEAVWNVGATIDATAKGVGTYDIATLPVAFDLADPMNAAFAPATLVGNTTVAGGFVKSINVVTNGELQTVQLVLKRDLTAMTILAPDVEYSKDGSARTPVVVKDGTKTLVKGADYSIVYSNNTGLELETVTATAEITGLKDYAGVVTTNFLVMGRLFTWVGPDYGDWGDSNNWDRVGVGTGTMNGWPGHDGEGNWKGYDTAKFESVPCIVTIPKEYNKPIKRLVDEEDSVITFLTTDRLGKIGRWRSIAAAGTADRPQSYKGTIRLVSETGTRGYCLGANYGLPTIENTLYVTNSTDGLPANGAIAFGAANAKMIFEDSRFHQSKGDASYVSLNNDVADRPVVLALTNTVWESQYSASNALGRAATVTISHSDIRMGMVAGRFGGDFTIDNSIAAFNNVRRYGTIRDDDDFYGDTPNIDNLTISGDSTKFALSGNCTASGEWHFVMPAGGFTNDIDHLTNTQDNAAYKNVQVVDLDVTYSRVAPVAIGKSLNLAAAKLTVDASAITENGRYPLVRVGTSGTIETAGTDETSGTAGTVGATEVTVADPWVTYGHVEPAETGVGLDLVVEDRIALTGVSATNQTYASAVRTPDFGFTTDSGAVEGLVEGVDYAVAWTNEAGVGVSKEELVAAGTYTATVTGINRYKGTVTCPFTIDRKVLTIEGLEAVDHPFNGDNPNRFAVSGVGELVGVVDGDDVALNDPIPDSALSWSYNSVSHTWGTGGQQWYGEKPLVYLNYSGYTSAPCTNLVLTGAAAPNYIAVAPVFTAHVTTAAITGLYLASRSSVYDGTDQKGKIISVNAAQSALEANGKKFGTNGAGAAFQYRLFRDEACTEETTDFTSVGTIWVVGEPKEGRYEFSGAATNSYTILPRDVSGAGRVEIELDPEEYAWTGHDIVPQFKVWDRSLDDALVPEDQYMAFYENNRAPTDSAKVLVMMKEGSNWKGSVLTNFWITAYNVEYYQGGEQIGGAERFGAVSGQEVYARVSVPDGRCLDWQNSETNGVVRRYDHSVVDTHDLLTLRVRYETDENGDGVPDKYQRKLYFKVAHGYWNDGSRYDVPFWVTLMTGDRWDVEGSGSVPSGLVPAVGERPFDSTYDKSGVWFPELSEVVRMETLPFWLFVYNAKSSVSGRGRGGRSGSAEPTMTSLSAVKSIRSFAVGQNEAVFNLGVAVVEQGTGATVIEADLNDMRVEFETTDSLGGGWTGVKVMTDGKGDATLKTGSAASRFYQLRK